MNDNITTHTVIREFKVEIERIDADDEDMECQYKASCPQLTGCTVHASSRDEAENKIERAIDVWIDYANRQLDSFDVDNLFRIISSLCHVSPFS
jgi:predicted RNase H-like HicB family nuclease